ncbi:MAG: DUF2905 domain-containing protein [Anaerolineae bacterium]|nr:DUF2905 domain-containing protein [Anaerolineae bacterium]
MDIQLIGRILLIVGILLALAGGLLLVVGRLVPLGRLPGDLRIDGPGFSCIVPIASMLIISVILTVLLNIVIRIINRP